MCAVLVPMQAAMVSLLRGAAVPLRDGVKKVRIGEVCSLLVNK